ncbi:MAG: sodium:solute symporter [Bacteroidaceae bacterium]|nr:sodium:solute symporter [Bacteroidaceae bacterium]
MNEALTAITILAYFLLLLVVSKLTGKDATNDSFFRAGRKSPWFLVAFGMIGASVSGVSFVSVPGYVGVTQMTYLQMCLGFFLGYLIIAFVLLPMYYRRGLTTIYTYLGQRFGGASHKTGTIFFLLSKMTGACARFFLVCLILQQFVFNAIGISFVFTVLIMLLLVWLYTRRAGIRTLVYTDTLQTLSMLTALVVVTVLIARQMGLDFNGLCSMVTESHYGRIFVFDDLMSKQSFWKQFLSGVFVAIVMTGLDQDMIQKNLTSKNLREAQKDMCTYGICFIPVNLLFLVLGVLLYTFAASQGIATPQKTDELFPMLVQGGYFGYGVTILFVLGIAAAAFSSVDSALTALTTSFCIDILDIEQKNVDEQKAVRVRRMVHIGVVALFVVFTLIFKALNNTSVIDAIYIMASYTYGPLLGLFSFGLFTKRLPRDRFVPVVCVLSPLICYSLSVLVPKWTGYHFGYELLMLNGLLTFMGLWMLSRNAASRKV